MPKQPGPILIEGTLGTTTFYKRKGVWWARAKTSLNKTRVSTDPAFEASRRASAGFGKAAQLAKKIYWQLPARKRGRGIIGKITGAVHTLQLQGLLPGIIEKEMLKKFGN